MKTVFVNPERCIGCHQCEFACAVEHSQSRDATLAVFESPLPRPRIHVMPGRAAGTSFPHRCRHCEPAPCVQICPTGSMTRDAAHDLVLTDPHRCITCAMCAMVCPFDAITFHQQTNGVPVRVSAIKCDGCLDRTTSGREPACVESCMTGALVYGELNQLIAEGRARETNAVLTSAAHAEAGSARPPDHVMAWRGWGVVTTNLNLGVNHGHH